MVLVDWLLQQSPILSQTTRQRYHIIRLRTNLGMSWVVSMTGARKESAAAGTLLVAMDMFTQKATFGQSWRKVAWVLARDLSRGQVLVPDSECIPIHQSLEIWQTIAPGKFWQQPWTLYSKY